MIDNLFRTLFPMIKMSVGARAVYRVYARYGRREAVPPLPVPAAAPRRGAGGVPAL